MDIWAIADLHLPFGDPSKSMELFGPLWHNYTSRLQNSWDSLVRPEDLVLIAGDISWAMRLDQALPDLAWIHERPGTKVMIRGNHDYWWGSATKVRAALPPSLHIIHNDVYCSGGVAISGTRLWDSPSYNASALSSCPTTPTKESDPQDPHIYHREIERLKMSLEKLPAEASLKIAMTHFPPIGPDLSPSDASILFEQHNVSIVVFGHLHGLKPLPQVFGTVRGVHYILTSCDWLNCTPLRIAENVS